MKIRLFCCWRLLKIFWTSSNEFDYQAFWQLYIHDFLHGYEGYCGEFLFGFIWALITFKCFFSEVFAQSWYLFVFNGITILHPTQVIFLWESRWLDSCFLFFNTFPQSLHSQGSSLWTDKWFWKAAFLEKHFPHEVQRKSAIMS